MDLVYLLLTFVGGFLVFIIVGYSFLTYFLYSDKLTDLDDKQKQKCEEKISQGKSSLLCRFYVKRGKCPNGKCEAIIPNK